MEKIKNIKWEISAREIYLSNRKANLYFVGLILMIVMCMLLGLIGWDRCFNVLYLVFYILIIFNVLLLVIKRIGENKILYSYGNSSVESYRIDDSGIYFNNILKGVNNFYAWSDLRFCGKSISTNFDLIRKPKNYFIGTSLMILDSRNNRYFLKLNGNQEKEIINEISKKIEIKSF